MTQALLARQDLDEGAELLDRDDLALVGHADLGLLGHELDLTQGFVNALGEHAGDRHGPVVGDVDLGARRVLQTADDLAAWADDRANLLRVDLDLDQTRRKSRQLRARPTQGSEHLLEDVQATDLGLFECLFEQFARQTLALDVHLQGSDAFLRAGDLEVHVAAVVLGALDVGEDGDLVAFLHETHRDAGNGLLDRHAGVHERERRPADRSH